MWRSGGRPRKDRQGHKAQSNTTGELLQAPLHGVSLPVLVWTVPIVVGQQAGLAGGVQATESAGAPDRT